MHQPSFAIPILTAINVAAATLVDRIGRRPLFLISNVGMLIVFIFWTLTTALWTTQENRPAASATIAFMPIYFLAYSIAYTPMLVSYTVEILPYGIRARGFAAMVCIVSNLFACFVLLFLN